MRASEAHFIPRSGESWRDPYPMYASLRRFDPVHHVDHGDYWVLTRFDDVYAAARDHRRFSSASGLTFTYGERERIGLDAIAPMVMLDPPEHTAFRRLVARAMTPRKVSAIEDRLRGFAMDRLLAWDGVGEIDLVSSYAMAIANYVVAHFLGVPEADRDRFGVWTAAIVEANASGDVASAGKRLGELVDYFSALIAERRKHPGDDLLSMLVQSDGTDAAVPDAQILGFAFTMVAGGNDTASGLISQGAAMLSRCPLGPWFDRSAATLEPNVIEELVRLISPVQGLARTTTEPVTLAAKQIPAGKKVLLCYGSANRDAAEFGESADAFEPGRPIRRMLAFGSGAHHCLGAAAARLEARVSLACLLSTFANLEIDEDAGRFANGNYVRRYDTLPCRPGPIDAGTRLVPTP